MNYLGMTYLVMRMINTIADREKNNKKEEAIETLYVSRYNIFIMANISTIDHPEIKISRFFSLIGQPARVQILIAISLQEACVCHIEAVLGMRQASISQHLMVLRKSGLVTSRRDGRNIFYQLANHEVLDMLERAAQLMGCDSNLFQLFSQSPAPGCPCPKCNPDIDPALTCQKK